MTLPPKIKTFGTANVLAPPPHARRLIGPKDLPSKGISYNLNHLRRMWKRGEFPTPVYTSARRFSWPEEVLDRWIDEKIALTNAETLATHKNRVLA
jgi:hypothetical protein